LEALPEAVRGTVPFVFWGLNYREWLLTGFIFGLVFFASWIPKLGAAIGKLFDKSSGRSS
jgi:hypothetical protein